MTDRDLIAEGREKLAAATVSPWTIRPHLDTWEVRDTEDVLRADGCGKGHAEFIAWARTELPGLLDELDKLRAWRERVVAQGRRAVTDPDRFHRIYDPQQPDLAIVIDAMLDERDSLRDSLAAVDAALLEFDEDYPVGAEGVRTLIGEALAHVGRVNAYRYAMRDVRRLLTDFGVTNPPPRLKALLESEVQS